jgi:energy-coupling factor transporter transmembrane protein EcfT
MGWRDQRFDLKEWLFFGLLILAVVSAAILLLYD